MQVNITDCESLGPGELPDALIPDVDSFVHEKRNAFPLIVPPGENRQVLVDIFVPPDTPAGNYRGTITMSSSGPPPPPLPFQLTVMGFRLPSTSSLGSEYGITSRQILAGHKLCAPGALCPANALQAAERFELFRRYLDMGLMHRISAASELDDPRWTVPTLDGNGSWPRVRSPFTTNS